MKIRFLAALILLVTTAFSRAELSVPHFFSDHLVLQRDRECAVWGWADPGETVTVAFKGKQAEATADAQGKWKVLIPTGSADATGARMTISSEGGELTIDDILVGEVWFASGQSNMYFTMNRVPEYEPLIAQSSHPGLRMFNAPLVTAREPQTDIEGEWVVSTPETVNGFSAVAFFFARKLHLDLGIPVGVIKSAWGGKPVETFTSREALQTLPGTRKLVDAVLQADPGFDPVQAQKNYESQLEQWKEAVAGWRNADPASRPTRPPRKPSEPKAPLDKEGNPGVLFNSMIHPFAGYTMRGAIWYQGEGNAKPGAVPYDQTLPLMVRDWRSRWDDDFSFYFVQLANYRQPSTEPGNNDPWPLLQDRMRRILETTPKTGMAVTNDIGEADDIHPRNKKDVGERLALWALARDYGDSELVYSGPLYREHAVVDGGIKVSFDHAGAGLRARDGGKLARFEIAGEDRTWHWAEARLDGSDAIIVSSPSVPAPIAVRYAWAANPEGANLVNSEGLPASVFRTDDWDDIEDRSAIAAQELAAERRALAVEIRELKAKREQLDRNGDEFRTVNSEFQEKMKRFKELSAQSR